MKQSYPKMVYYKGATDQYRIVSDEAEHEAAKREGYGPIGSVPDGGKDEYQADAEQPRRRGRHSKAQAAG
jgi:hypothetical protein